MGRRMVWVRVRVWELLTGIRERPAPFHRAPPRHSEIPEIESRDRRVPASPTQPGEVRSLTAASHNDKVHPGRVTRITREAMYFLLGRTGRRSVAADGAGPGPWTRRLLILWLGWHPYHGEALPTGHSGEQWVAVRLPARRVRAGHRGRRLRSMNEPADQRRSHSFVVPEDS